MDYSNIPSKEQYVIGVDVGGTNIKICIMDFDNNIVCKDSIPTNAQLPWQTIVKNMINPIENMILNCKIKKEQCLYMGIGIPGIVDNLHGKVVYANNLGWKDVLIADEINKYLTIDVFLENDANCAAYGEYIKGQGSSCGDMVLITLGTGVGTGVIIDGKIFSGSGLGGAELGHTTLIYNGLQCSCGRKGCAEVYVSATALIEQANMALKSDKTSLMNKLKEEEGNMNGEIPFKAAKMGDSLAIGVVEQYKKYLGAFIVNVVNIFRPDAVFISGGICNQGESLLDTVREYVYSNSYGAKVVDVPPVNIATLGNSAGMVGAASLYKQFL